MVSSASISAHQFLAGYKLVAAVLNKPQTFRKNRLQEHVSHWSSPTGKSYMWQAAKALPVSSLWHARASHFHTSKVMDAVIKLDFPCMVFSTSCVQHFWGHFKTWFIQEIIPCLLFVS